MNKVYIITCEAIDKDEEYYEIRRCFASREQAEEYISTIGVHASKWYDYNIIEMNVE